MLSLASEGVPVPVARNDRETENEPASGVTEGLR